MSLGPLVFHRDAVGVRQLGIGLFVVVDIVVFGGLVAFVITWGQYPRPWLCLVAWILLPASLAVAQAVLLTRAEAFGPRITGLYLAALAAVVLLDIAGSWDTRHIGSYPLAAMTAGGALLVIAPVARRNVVLTATGVFAAALVLSFGFETRPKPLAAAPNLVAITVAVGTPLLGIFVVDAFRAVVQRELDRLQAASRAKASPFTAGVFASEDLAELDSAAEQLLDDVASGRAPLPLDRTTAGAAGALASELRLHLLAGRTETWLMHAVAESPFLRPAVVLVDPEARAGLLDRDQRDGLLSAIWLLTGDLPPVGGDVTVEFSVEEGMSGGAVNMVTITVRVPGIPAAAVDPEIITALGRVGTMKDSDDNRAIGFHATMECRVDHPVDL